MAMQGKRRERSRSPRSVDTVGRRRDSKNHDRNKSGDTNTNLMNQMLMYQQGNLMMASGMYSNMMMPGTMMGGAMIPSTGMELMSQSSMNIASMDGQNMASPNTSAMEMGMMGGMMMDSSVMGVFPGTTGEMATIPEKKEIVLKHCKLIPPDPGTVTPRRNKPPGCRTIFVGGLPDKIRESTVREIFENYGKIHTMRLSKKNFCHIRYDKESSVDAAMDISGYRIKLIYRDEKDDDDNSHPTSGWLQVDYALSRDDQNEFERRQRQSMRVQQVQDVSSRSSVYNRTPSPVWVQPFSNAVSVQFLEKIKNEELFPSTLPTLLAWLERGECSKKNSNQFYSMIQTTNAHIRRLFNEKMQVEDEFHECKEKAKNSIEPIIEQLEQVAKVFTAAMQQRVWDHFTKPQRKNIETWQKMSQEFQVMKEEFLEKFCNDDNDSNETNRADHNTELVQQLKRENESLQFQLEAYRNEVDVIKIDAQKEMEKFKAQFIAQQALQEINKQMPVFPSSSSVKPILPLPPPIPEDVNSKDSLKETVEAGCGEAKLIGIMSAFLQVHPQGASLDYVISYVRGVFPNVSQATIHHTLQKHGDVFRKTTTGVGANIEHRWYFVAFEEDKKSI